MVVVGTSMIDGPDTTFPASNLSPSYTETLVSESSNQTFLWSFFADVISDVPRKTSKTYSRVPNNSSDQISILLEDISKINNNSHYNKNSVGRFSEIFGLFPAQKA